MATTPEGKVKAKIKAVLKKHNVYYFMPMGFQFGRSGIPDFVCCHKGQFLAIEAKAPGGKVSALQRVEIDNINRHGGNAFIVASDESIGLLDEMLSQ